MSDAGISSGSSSETGLTFVRPLPQAEAPRSDSSRFNLIQPDVNDRLGRLFPPRKAEDSGNIAPVTGLELGHFVIEERIGRGGMGAVFRALDRRLDRVVALKVLSAEHSSDPEAVLRFQNEARAAAKLDHDNISRVHYIGEEDGLHFIAFEFVTGTNVRNFIVQKGKLTQQDAVNYTLQIAEALRQTAAAGVVHRDIKPSNIIISPTGRAKLVDLGLARHIATEASKDLTVAGTTLGTFDYIAPEQAMDARNVDVRTDIYSLGCTLYHMLTGEPPYPNGTMFEKVMNHHGPLPPDPAAKNPRVSPQLARVVQKMMASNPDERYPTPEALINDLVLIADALGLQPAHPEAVVWSSPLFKKRSPIWDATRTWMVAALGLLIVAFLADRWSANSGPAAVAPENTPAEVALQTSSDADVSPAEQALEPGSTSNQQGNLTNPGKKNNDGATIGTALQSGQLSDRLSQVASSLGARPDLLSNPQSRGPSITSISPADAIAETIADAARQTAGMTPTVDTPEKTPTSLIEAVNEPYVLIIPGQAPKAYTSLAAACNAATNNAVIEIGPTSAPLVISDALKVTNKRIKIRPQGSFRPHLRFELAHRATSTFSRVGRMITLSHAALEMYDVDIELVINPESPAEMWTMLSMANEAEVLIRGCSLTMVNRDQIPAAFLHLPPHEIAELADSMPDRMKLKPSQISISESVLRGQGDFLYQQNVDTGRVSLEDVALAISGSMFRVNGANSHAPAMNLEESEEVSISMTQVTAALGAELLHMNSGNHGEMPVINFDIRDSIVRIDQLDRPLITLMGHQDYEVLLEKLQWADHSDQLFLQVDGPFCEVDSPTLLNGIQQLSSDELGYTNIHDTNMNILKLPMATLPTELHTIQPQQFQLIETSLNPGLGATSDGRNVGVDWTLSRIPAELE